VNLKLSAKKCRFIQPELPWIGHIISYQQNKHCGNQVNVETDHKPLVVLVDKPIGLCTPRIQRMRLQLQSYSYQLQYKPGKELYLADTLSRAPEPREYSTELSP